MSEKIWEFRAGCHMAPDDPCTCDACKAATAATVRAAKDEQARTLRSADDFSPLDPYERELKTLRAAEATPESRFEDGWKADRLRAFAAEHAKMVAAEAARPRMTAAEEAEVAAFAPPDPYAAGIKALRAKEAR